MFETLTPAKPDPILTIMAAFREDKRADKIDVSVGVYKDEAGGTPIVAAVREAELLLHAQQQTKTYLGPLGDVGFNDLMRGLVFGQQADKARIRTAQTPGGCGALRLLADLVAAARPDATVHIPDPTWVNHEPLLASSGLKLKSYSYFDRAGGGVRFAAGSGARGRGFGTLTGRSGSIPISAHQAVRLFRAVSRGSAAGGIGSGPEWSAKALRPR